MPSSFWISEMLFVKANMIHFYGLIFIEVCTGICLQENDRDTRIKYVDQNEINLCTNSGMIQSNLFLQTTAKRYIN